MKTYLFSVLTALLLTTTLTAQKLSPGIYAGVNFQNINGKNETGDKLTNNLITGFHAGVNLLMPIAPEIYFEPALQFSVKGAGFDYIPSTATVRINYLELPLNLVYRGQLGNNFILLELGPYLGYALGGKMTVGDLKQDLQFGNSVPAGEESGAAWFRRFDAGAGISAGYELSGGLFLKLETQLGLMNIKSDNKNVANDRSAYKNTGFGLSVGYRF